MKNKKKCYSCKFSGQPFKIAKVTHQHCEHPKFKELFEKGELSAWDTLNSFSSSCSDYEHKT